MCHARVRVRCGQGRLGYGLIRSWNVFSHFGGCAEKEAGKSPFRFSKKPGAVFLRAAVGHHLPGN